MFTLTQGGITYVSGIIVWQATAEMSKEDEITSKGDCLMRENNQSEQI